MKVTLLMSLRRLSGRDDLQVSRELEKRMLMMIILLAAKIKRFMNLRKNYRI